MGDSQGSVSVAQDTLQQRLVILVGSDAMEKANLLVEMAMVGGCFAEVKPHGQAVLLTIHYSDEDSLNELVGVFLDRLG